jgi:phosphate transport system substrate-binding protein
MEIEEVSIMTKQRRLMIWSAAVLLVIGVLIGGIAVVQGGQKNSNTPQRLTLAGSTAMGPLVQEAAKVYHADHPHAIITVQGGGSAAGLTKVADGHVSMGMSDIFAEEKNGVVPDNLVDHKIAVVGIVPVVNPRLSIKNIGTVQLRQIFAGQITNWQKLGGPDMPITVINRAQGSGTRTSFDRLVLNGGEPKTGLEQESSDKVRSMVATTPGSISYLALSYVNSDVQAMHIDNITPSKKNIVTGTWPLWAYEHLYVKGKPTVAEVQFIQYLQSAKVQRKLVSELGYIPIADMKVERTAEGQIEDVQP